MPLEPACTPPRRIDALPGLPWPLHDVAATRAIEGVALATRPRHQLMARAGLAAARLALSLAAPGSRFWVAAGPGNNGGDGLVAATWLHRRGQTVRVSLCADPARLPEDAAWALQRALAAGVPIDLLSPQADAQRQASLPALPEGSWIIDALLGLGRRGGLPPADRRTACAPPASTLDTLIVHIQQLRRNLGCRVLAIDLPSGLDGDSGRAGGTHDAAGDERPGAVVADHTLSLLTLKPGLCTGDGLHHAGQIWWHGLGVVATPEGAGAPASCAYPGRGGSRLAGAPCGDDTAAPGCLAPENGTDRISLGDDEPEAPLAQHAGRADEGAAPRGTDETPAPVAWRLPAPRWPARESHRHKGSYGDVLVLGGSGGMAGAARLAADAALQAGGGRVWVGRPTEAGDGRDDASPDCPQAATEADEARFVLHEGLPPELMQASMPALCSPTRLARATVVCGCGGGTAITPWLPEVLRHAHRLVLDADALNAVAADAPLQRLLRARADHPPPGARWPTVLTPHPLEAARLLGLDVAAVQADRLGSARTLARVTGAVVLLKGSGTVLAIPTGDCWINPRGSARLATPGSGDVLAGWIGGTWSACGDVGGTRLWPRPGMAAGTAGTPGPADPRPAATASAARPHPGDDPTLAVAAACAWLHGRAGEAPPHGLPLRAGEIARAMAALGGSTGTGDGTFG